MRNGGVICLSLLLALTVGSGVLAMAKQLGGTAPAVAPPVQLTGSIYIGAEQTGHGTHQPVAASRYTPDHPATLQPVLQWSRIDGAVMYDIQVLQKSGAGALSYYEPVMVTQRSYATAYELPLPPSFAADRVYWRVQPMNLQGQPVGDFSALETAYVDRTKEIDHKPVLLSEYNQGKEQTLLYPVYDWVAVPDADHYEVEILDDAPENPNDTEPSVHRIDAYTPQYAQQYDAKPRMSSRPFYWRVRAVAGDGSPLGVYSDARSFLTDPQREWYAAIYGDSISHGGGSVSYSPADWEFSYGHYLSFPTINLARSGDTSEMTAERFEQDVVPFHPQYLLILMGSNSLRAGADPDDVIADMEAVKEKCLAHGIRPVFLTVPPLCPDNIKKAFNQDTFWGWREAIAAVNEYIAAQVHVDITPGLADANGELRTDLALDGLHLDPPGKQMMADAINAAWPDIVNLPDSAWDT